MQRLCPSIFRTASALVLGALVTACASQGSAVESTPAMAGGASAEEKKTDDTEVRGKEIALELANYDLALAKLDVEGKERSAAAAVEMARTDLQHTRQSNEHAAAERKIRMEEMELNVQRSRNRLTEQMAELAELESMYAAEEFAEKTKELVLTRGKTSVEMAKASLALSERRLALLANEQEMQAAKQKVALHKAELAVQKAELDREQSKIQAKVRMMQAEKKVMDAEAALAKVKG